MTHKINVIQAGFIINAAFRKVDLEISKPVRAYCMLALRDIEIQDDANITITLAEKIVENFQFTDVNNLEGFKVALLKCVEDYFKAPKADLKTEVSEVASSKTGHRDETPSTSLSSELQMNDDYIPAPKTGLETKTETHKTELPKVDVNLPKTILQSVVVESDYVSTQANNDSKQSNASSRVSLSSSQPVSNNEEMDDKMLAFQKIKEGDAKQETRQSDFAKEAKEFKTLLPSMGLASGIQTNLSAELSQSYDESKSSVKMDSFESQFFISRLTTALEEEKKEEGNLQQQIDDLSQTNVITYHKGYSTTQKVTRTDEEQKRIEGEIRKHRGQKEQHTSRITAIQNGLACIKKMATLSQEFVSQSDNSKLFFETLGGQAWVGISRLRSAQAVEEQHIVANLLMSLHYAESGDAKQAAISMVVAYQLATSKGKQDEAADNARRSEFEAKAEEFKRTLRYMGLDSGVQQDLVSQLNISPFNSKSIETKLTTALQQKTIIQGEEVKEIKKGLACVEKMAELHQAFVSQRNDSTSTLNKAAKFLGHWILHDVFKQRVEASSYWGTLLIGALEEEDESVAPVFPSTNFEIITNLALQQISPQQISAFVTKLLALFRAPLPTNAQQAQRAKEHRQNTLQALFAEKATPLNGKIWEALSAEDKKEDLKSLLLILMSQYGALTVFGGKTVFSRLLATLPENLWPVLTELNPLTWVGTAYTQLGEEFLTYANTVYSAMGAHGSKPIFPPKSLEVLLDKIAADTTDQSLITQRRVLLSILISSLPVTEVDRIRQKYLRCFLEDKELLKKLQDVLEAQSQLLRQLELDEELKGVQFNELITGRKVDDIYQEMTHAASLYNCQDFETSKPKGSDERIQVCIQKAKEFGSIDKIKDFRSDQAPAVKGMLDPWILAKGDKCIAELYGIWDKTKDPNVKKAVYLCLINVLLAPNNSSYIQKLTKGQVKKLIEESEDSQQRVSLIELAWQNHLGSDLASQQNDHWGVCSLPLAETDAEKKERRDRFNKANIIDLLRLVNGSQLIMLIAGLSPDASERKTILDLMLGNDAYSPLLRELLADVSSEDLKHLLSQFNETSRNHVLKFFQDYVAEGGLTKSESGIFINNVLQLARPDNTKWIDDRFASTSAMVRQASIKEQVRSAAIATIKEQVKSAAIATMGCSIAVSGVEVAAKRVASLTEDNTIQTISDTNGFKDFLFGRCGRLFFSSDTLACHWQTLLLSTMIRMWPGETATDSTFYVHLFKEYFQHYVKLLHQAQLAKNDSIVEKYMKGLRVLWKSCHPSTATGPDLKPFMIVIAEQISMDPTLVGEFAFCEKSGGGHRCQDWVKELLEQNEAVQSNISCIDNLFYWGNHEEKGLKPYMEAVVIEMAQTPQLLVQACSDDVEEGSSPAEESAHRNAVLDARSAVFNQFMLTVSDEQLFLLLNGLLTSKTVTWQEREKVMQKISAFLKKADKEKLGDDRLQMLETFCGAVKREVALHSNFFIRMWWSSTEKEKQWFDRQYKWYTHTNCQLDSVCTTSSLSTEALTKTRTEVLQLPWSVFQLCTSKAWNTSRSKDAAGVTSIVTHNEPSNFDKTKLRQGRDTVLERILFGGHKFGLTYISRQQLAKLCLDILQSAEMDWQDRMEVAEKFSVLAKKCPNGDEHKQVFEKFCEACKREAAFEKAKGRWLGGLRRCLFDGYWSEEPKERKWLEAMSKPCTVSQVNNLLGVSTPPVVQGVNQNAAPAVEKKKEEAPLSSSSVALFSPSSTENPPDPSFPSATVSAASTVDEDHTGEKQSPDSKEFRSEIMKRYGIPETSAATVVQKDQQLGVPVVVEEQKLSPSFFPSTLQSHPNVQAQTVPVVNGSGEGDAQSIDGKLGAKAKTTHKHTKYTKHTKNQSSRGDKRRRDAVIEDKDVVINNTSVSVNSSHVQRTTT